MQSFAIRHPFGKPSEFFIRYRSVARNGYKLIYTLIHRAPPSEENTVWIGNRARWAPTRRGWKYPLPSDRVCSSEDRITSTRPKCQRRNIFCPTGVNYRPFSDGKPKIFAYLCWQGHQGLPLRAHIECRRRSSFDPYPWSIDGYSLIGRYAMRRRSVALRGVKCLLQSIL